MHAPTFTCCWWRAPPRDSGEEASSPTALSFPRLRAAVLSTQLISSTFSLPFSAAHHLDTKFNAHSLFHLQILSSILILFLKTCSVIERTLIGVVHSKALWLMYTAAVSCCTYRRQEIFVFNYFFQNPLPVIFEIPFGSYHPPIYQITWTSLIWNITFLQKLGELSLLN